MRWAGDGAAGLRRKAGRHPRREGAAQRCRLVHAANSATVQQTPAMHVRTISQLVPNSRACHASAHLLHQPRQRQAAACLKPCQAGGQVVSHDFVVGICAVQLLCRKRE